MSDLPPVIIVGKGASAREIPASDRYRVAAISEAVRLVERCDWLGINDVAALDQMLPDDFAKCLNVILPTFLHCDPRGKATKPWRECVRWTCPTLLYRLPTAPEPGDEPYFGRCWSTSESLIAMLIHLGYRQFALAGISKKSKKYHPAFKPRTKKKAAHFKRNWERMMSRIASNGCELLDVEGLL